MAYKIGDRMQQTFLPNSIEQYVSEADPVRVYDAFVDALDFAQLGIPITPFKAGADTYYPKQMVKLIVYGYSYGLRSSRKLERACQHNLSFIWLMGGLTPAYRTIARFRDQHKAAIKQILKQAVKMCIKLDLIDGNTLFIDGSVFKANASLSHTWNHERCEKALTKINEHIDKLVDEIQRLDREEQDQGSLAEVKEQLRNQEQRKQQVEAIAAELNQRQSKCSKEQTAAYNTTDPESIKMHKRGKTAQGYNVQLAVDKKHGLIVHCESTDAHTDNGQLNPQMEQAAQTLGHKPKTVCSDTGYYSLKELAEVDPTVILVVPNQKQVVKERYGQESKPFDKENFQYDAKQDQYVCPAQRRLYPVGADQEKQFTTYRAHVADCLTCSNRQECCRSSRRGRTIKRSFHEPLKEKLQTIYDSPEGQEVYDLRKENAELPFGHFKRNLSAERFLLKGKDGTGVEASLLSIAFNITRMITLIGVPQLLSSLRVT
jgi:transposase